MTIFITWLFYFDNYEQKLTDGESFYFKNVVHFYCLPSRPIMRQWKWSRNRSRFSLLTRRDVGSSYEINGPYTSLCKFKVHSNHTRSQWLMLDKIMSRQTQYSTEHRYFYFPGIQSAVPDQYNTLGVFLASAVKLLGNWKYLFLLFAFCFLCFPFFCKKKNDVISHPAILAYCQSYS